MASKVFYDTGAYVGEVVNQGLGETKEKGTPFFFLKVKVLGLTMNDSYVPASQQYERTVYFYLSAGAMPNTAENLRALGFQGQTLAVLDLSHPSPISFVGDQVDLYCNHEEYNGDMREKWNLSRPFEVPKIEPKRLRQLDALFGKALKDVPAKASSPPPEARTKATKKRADGSVDYGFDQSVDDPSDPGITEEDIPF